MNKINVGFIGCGRISGLHYEGYKNNPSARLYALCDTDHEILASRKKEWKAVKAYNDYRELLADPQVDAVEILSPTALHEEMTLEAIKAKKHIALQKTMTNTLQSADRIIAALEGYKKIFRVSDNYVWYPPFLMAKKIIDSGELGEALNLRIKFIMGQGGWDVPASAWAWRLRERSEGRPMNTFDHGHHLWAVAWLLQGPVERTSAWIGSLDGIVDAPAVIMWQAGGGRRYGICEYTYARDMEIPSKYYANDECFEITGTKGIILINRCTGHLIEKPALSHYNGKKWKHYTGIGEDWADGFKESARNFIASILGREEAVLNAQQARDVLRFDIAVQRSNYLQREVYLNELDSSFPSIYAWRMRRRAKNENAFRLKKNLLSSIFSGSSGYAGRAESLTDSMLERFNSRSASGWSSIIGIRLTKEGECPGVLYSLRVENGIPLLQKGSLPEKADMILTVPAGTWAAIILGKKRIEMALLQGKIKIEGRAEEGLKLREVFKL